MPSTAQQEARKRRLARERKARWRAAQPKPARHDGDEPFALPDLPPPVTVPQGPPWKGFIADKTEAAALVDAIPPSPPRRDPLLFNTASDPNRPPWFPPTEIRLAIDPRTPFLSPPIECQGQQFRPAKEARFTYSEANGHRDQLQEEYAAAKAAERASSRLIKAWTPGQTREGEYDE